MSALQTFDCNGCQVVLNIPPQAETWQIALRLLYGAAERQATEATQKR